MFINRRLRELNRDSLNALISGYVSDSKYAVRWEDGENQSVFSLELVKLATPYVKRYDAPDDATFERYQTVVRQGYSSGVYMRDELIGLAIAEYQQWNDALTIWEFHIAEAYQGKGLGAALMSTVVDKARLEGVRMLICETQNTNVPAIRFYRRQGFKLEGIDLSLYSNSDWPDGEIAVFMKRRLDYEIKTNR